MLTQAPLLSPSSLSLSLSLSLSPSLSPSPSRSPLVPLFALDVFRLCWVTRLNENAESCSSQHRGWPVRCGLMVILKCNKGGTICRSHGKEMLFIRAAKPPDPDSLPINVTRHSSCQTCLLILTDRAPVFASTLSWTAASFSHHLNQIQTFTMLLCSQRPVTSQSH